ncbi:MAG: hypothetical protein AAGC68_05255, partial [Verrucomicrobiota bacterium]
MGKFVEFFKENTAFRRCLAFVFHVIGIAGCYLLAHLIRFDFDVPPKHWVSFKGTLLLVIGIYLACIFAFRLYRGLWRFFTLRDCLITAVAFAVGTLLCAGAIFLINDFSFEGIPRSVLVISYLLLLLWEIGGRGMVRLARESRYQKQSRERNGGRILLVGDPEEADALLRGSQKRSSELGTVTGIFSEDPKHHGSQLRGVRIYSGKIPVTVPSSEERFCDPRRSASASSGSPTSRI